MKKMRVHFMRMLFISNLRVIEVQDEAEETRSFLWGTRFFVILWVLGLPLSPPCRAQLEDSVRSSTNVGSGGVVSQFIEVSNHILMPESVENSNAFIREMERSRAAEGEAKPLGKSSRPAPVLPLSWILGAGYLYSTSAATAVDPIITDSTYSFLMGLGWEVSSRVDMTLKVGGDASPEERYSRRSVRLKILSTLFAPSSSSEKQRRRDHFDSEDARDYFGQKREIQASKNQQEATRILKIKKPKSRFPAAADLDDDDLDDEIVPGDQKKEESPFPNLKFAIQFGFDDHTVGSKTFRRPSFQALSSTGGMSGASILELLTGTQLIYSPSSWCTLTVGAFFYSYNNSVNNFIPSIESAVSTHFPVMTGDSWATATNQFLSFPSLSFDASIDFHVSESSRFSLNLNQTYYSSALMTPTSSFNPVFLTDFSRKWGFGLGTHLVQSSSLPFLIAGSVFFSYKL